MRRKKKYKTRSDTSTKKRKAVKRKLFKRKTTAIRTRNMGRWTEAEYFQRIRRALRRAFRFWEPMQEALRRASRPSQSSNKRLKIEYKCASCSNWFPRTQVQIDHIVECGSLNKYEDIAGFIERLTKEEVEAYQVLCKPCHKVKTDEYKESKKAK